MQTKEIFDGLRTAIIEGDSNKARENAEECIKASCDPLDAVENGLSPGMITIGDQFQSGEAFLPELMKAARTFNAAMEILQPELEKKKQAVAKLGTVLIGTVKGDVHSIGKDIVATVLKTNGFDVVDIGVDRSPLDFIQEAEKVKADVIALSALMTTTMPFQQEVVDALVEKNIRDKYFVIVGGGPVSDEWAQEIHCDGYGGSAIDAVNLIKKLMNGKTGRASN